MNEYPGNVEVLSDNKTMQESHIDKSGDSIVPGDIVPAIDLGKNARINNIWNNTIKNFKQHKMPARVNSWQVTENNIVDAE